LPLALLSNGYDLPLSFSGLGVVAGGVVALDDLSELDGLDDAPVDGVEFGLDEAIGEDGGDEGLEGLLDDMLDELGGVVDEVVLWRSLQATASNDAAIATDSMEAFICFSFRDECGMDEGKTWRMDPPSSVHSTERDRSEPSVRSRWGCRRLPTRPHDLQDAPDSDARDVALVRTGVRLVD